MDARSGKRVLPAKRKGADDDDSQSQISSTGAGSALTQLYKAASAVVTIIAVYNFKGGVGKTSLVINLASTLAAEHKKRVLMADMDPSGNLTSFFNPGLSPEAANNPAPPQADADNGKAVQVDIWLTPR